MSAVAQKIREYYASNYTDYTEEKNLFLEGFRQKGVVQGGLDLARISRTTVYMWRSLDPEFRQAWDEVKESCNDNARQSMYEMATSGKNVVAGIFYLKHNCPEYRERVTVDVNVMQREVEEKIVQLSQRLPANASLARSAPASLKDIVYDAMGIERPGSKSVVEVELPGNTPSSSPGVE